MSKEFELTSAKVRCDTLALVKEMIPLVKQMRDQSNLTQQDCLHYAVRGYYEQMTRQIDKNTEGLGAA